MSCVIGQPSSITDIIAYGQMIDNDNCCYDCICVGMVISDVTNNGWRRQRSAVSLSNRELGGTGRTSDSNLVMGALAGILN